MSFIASASVFIDAPPEEVFDRLADHPSWEKWMPKTFRPMGRSKGPLQVGRDVTCRIGGIPFPAKVQILVVDRAKEITWGGGIAGVLQARHRFLFEAEGSGTRVQSVESWEGRLARFVKPVLLPKAEKIGRDQLGALKSAVSK